MPRLKTKYHEEVAPALMKKYSYKSTMQIPKIEKSLSASAQVTAKTTRRLWMLVIKDISAIAGQKAVATTARKSVANFKLRVGQNVGVKVTLRQDRMWEFLDRLFNVSVSASVTSTASMLMPSTAAETTASV